MKWLSGLISKRKSKSNSVLNTQRFKKEQRRKQLQSVLKKAGLLLLGIVITSLLLVAVQFIRYYVQPLEPFNEFGVDDQETWAGEYQLNIGLWLREEGRSTFRNAIFIVKPSNPSAHVLVFPEEISTRDPDQLSLQFSLPIDRYLVSKQTLTFSSSSNDVITEQGNRFFEDLLDLSGYLSFSKYLQVMPDYIATDMSPRELLRIYQVLRSIPASDFTVENWSSDAQEFNKIQEEILQEVEIASESPRLWVRNTTNVAGLASHIASLGENLGFDVVRVDNADCSTTELQDVCNSEQTIIVAKESLQLTRASDRLEEMLEAEVEYIEVQDLKRADVVIYVGQDFEDYVDQKEKALPK